MAQQSIDENKLALQKRGIARRARRLAQTQAVEADRACLTQFADELDREAEALERLATSVSLPPVAPHRQVQQMQQQQSAGAPSPAQVPKEK